MNSTGYFEGWLLLETVPRYNLSNFSANIHGIRYGDTDPREDEWWLRVTFCVFMGILSVTGTFGNLFVIVSFMFVKELRKVRNAFVFNLAISDLFVNAVSMPFNILGAVHAGSFWYGRESLCTFISTICVPGCSSSIYSIGAIAFERYTCICHMGLHQKLFTPRNVTIMIILMWVHAHLIHLPNHSGWGSIYYDENFFLCWLDLRLWSYSFFYATVSVIIPILFSFYAYYMIYNKIRSSRLSRNLITQTKHETAKEKREKRIWKEEVMLVKTLFKMFIIFLVSWGPVAVLFSLNKAIDPPRWMNLLAILMAHGNSSTNSVIYYWMTGHFQTTLRAIQGKPNRVEHFSTTVAYIKRSGGKHSGAPSSEHGTVQTLSEHSFKKLDR